MTRPGYKGEVWTKAWSRTDAGWLLEELAGNFVGGKVTETWRYLGEKDRTYRAAVAMEAKVAKEAAKRKAKRDAEWEANEAAKVKVIKKPAKMMAKAKRAATHG